MNQDNRGTGTGAAVMDKTVITDTHKTPDNRNCLTFLSFSWSYKSRPRPSS